MIKHYDIVIVGTGIAGLSTLLYLTETQQFKSGALSIAIIAKDALDCTNTNWAQGGIAAVHAIGDSYEKHIRDTLIAGAFANNEAVVSKVIHAAPSLMQDLIKWGTLFDKNEEGHVDLAKEGGHSDSRIWHYKDQTGTAIEKALLDQLLKIESIDILSHSQVTQIERIFETQFQLQIYGLNTCLFRDITCSKLVLATGGLGMLYEKTTNQKVATGDGIYFAKKLGASIKDLSFIQFHPTGLYTEQNSTFLISEAVRGAGAILKDKEGRAFMQDYDPRADLAPRDIVSRAIIDVMQKTNAAYVYLDATLIDKSLLRAHFPVIKKVCLELKNIDIENQFIPIVPVQHYACGGIEVNEYGESTIPNLFAIGEVACTGLHGANRLASNSLLEAIAFAKFSINKLLDLPKIEYQTKPLPVPSGIKKVDIQFVQKTLSRAAGVLRSNKNLEETYLLLRSHMTEANIIEDFCLESIQYHIVLANAIDIVKNAIEQKENKGVHYNVDLVQDFIMN